MNDAAAPPGRAPPAPRAASRPRAWRKRLVVGLLAASVASLGAWRLLRPQPVAVERARVAPLVRTLVFTGRVSTESRVEVGSTLTGRVVEVTLREGAQVRAGQLLARLDDSEALAAVRQAEAAVRVARSRIGLQSQLARPTAEAALAQADATLRAAQAEFDRTRRLVERGFLSAARLDEARRVVDVARAQLDSASAQAGANAPRGPETEQARLRLEEALAAAQLARARLAQTRIVAPADGLVLVRSVEPGQVVQPGRVLFSMSISAPVQLVAQVDEKFLAQLAIGQQAAVVADAFPDRRFDASVRSIAPTVDPQRGAVEVKFSVPRPPPFLRNDMTLSLEVETARRPQALTVPAQAVRAAPGAGVPADAQGTGADGTGTDNTGAAATVRVLRDGRVAEVPIRTGVRALERVEVIDGLAAGDEVVVDPSVAIGRRARGVEPAQAARAAASKAGVTVRAGSGGPVGPSGSR